jgi:DNA polymerase-4
MASPRWILHADMDAFYASIEQRDRPELRRKPVIVGATSPRGVVAAASYEARRFGVRSAMPGFRARELCPDGVFLPSRIERYAAVSAEVHAVFRDFTPAIEPLALDEAFLDVSGSMHLFGGPEALARRLKGAVLDATELKVSVGLAPNKLVAKIACTLGKPDGLRIVSPDGVRGLLDPLPVGRLWGVGPVLREKLEAIGIHRFEQLAGCDRATLAAVVGRRADELQALARGQDDRPVQTGGTPRSCGEENTFESDVSDENRIFEVIAAHAEAVARRLRRGGYRGRTVTLKVKLARAESRGERGPNYPLRTRSKTLPGGTDDAARIADVARRLWQAGAPWPPVRLLGVSLSGIVAVPSEPAPPGSPRRVGQGVEREGAQLSLFASRARGPLGPTLDRIEARFGKTAIRRAVEAPGKVTPGRGIKHGD